MPPPLTRPVTRPGSSTFHTPRLRPSQMAFDPDPSRPRSRATSNFMEAKGKEGATRLGGGLKNNRAATLRSSFHHKFFPFPSRSKYYSVVAQSIIYPMWIFGWWLVPLNHRKTSRMRVETMMRAHHQTEKGEMVYCLASREFISRKKKFNLYFGGPVFSTLISPDVFSIIRAD